MRLRDRLHAAVQTFRGAPDIQSRLDTVEYELELADQALELRKKECDQLRDTMQEHSFRFVCTTEEKDSRIRFLDARSDALWAVLKEFPPMLSTTEEMKRFYDAVSYDLDPEGFTLYRVATKLTGTEVTSMFPYEDALGRLEEASGHQLLNYLISGRFGAVDWEPIPGTTYEKTILGEVDLTTPEYHAFEKQLYEGVLDRMGFGEFLVQGPEVRQDQEPQSCGQVPDMTMQL